MSAKELRDIFEDHFEVLGKIEDGKYSHHLLVKFHGSTALRLLSINTTRKLDVQLEKEFGGLEAFLRKAGTDARASDLFKLLRDLSKQAKTIEQPPSKAIEAYSILSRLHDLQNEKEQAPHGSRAALDNAYNDLALRLRFVDKQPE